MKKSFRPYFKTNPKRKFLINLERLHKISDSNSTPTYIIVIKEKGLKI